MLRARGQREVLPIVPLVLGGDDLTVVVDGRQALNFTRTFLDEFERRTAETECVSSILNQATKQRKLTSCAGIAIVKPHFPFHAAYELAEGLLKEAKAFAKDPSRKRPPFSALDFHVLYDASGPDLERIRAELEIEDGKTLLVARPYATTPGVETPRRHWDDLHQRVTAVRARNDDHRRRLPNSMLHELCARDCSSDARWLRAGSDWFGALPESGRPTRWSPTSIGFWWTASCSGKRLVCIERPPPARRAGRGRILGGKAMTPHWTLKDTFTIRITMISDWHVGSGTGRPGNIDRLVVRDSDGLPFVPAKTLRGIWRDACERLARGLDGGTVGEWSSLVDRVFGSQPALGPNGPTRLHHDPAAKPIESALQVRPARLHPGIRQRVRGKREFLEALTFVKPGVKIDRHSGRAQTRLPPLRRDGPRRHRAGR